GQKRACVSRRGGVTGNSSGIESAPGSYVAKAITSWDNTIPESNKNNNSATTSYSIEQRADSSAVSLLLNDADSDVSKRVFAMNEPIYINAQMRNLTPQVMPGTVTTTFFKTQTATVAAGTWTDIPSSINVSNWPASQTLHFRSRPGSSTASSFVGNTSWLAGDNETGTANDGPGDFVARM